MSLSISFSDVAWLAGLLCVLPFCFLYLEANIQWFVHKDIQVLLNTNTFHFLTIKKQVLSYFMKPTRCLFSTLLDICHVLAHSLGLSTIFWVARNWLLTLESGYQQNNLDKLHLVPWSRLLMQIVNSCTTHESQPPKNKMTPLFRLYCPSTNLQYHMHYFSSITCVATYQSEDIYCYRPCLFACYNFKGCLADLYTNCDKDGGKSAHQIQSRSQ